MSENKHKNMVLEQIWMLKGEKERLLDAMDNNDPNLVCDILLCIKKRGDL